MSPPLLMLLLLFSLPAHYWSKARRPVRRPTRVPVVSDDASTGVPPWASKPLDPAYPGMPPGTAWSGPIDVPCKVDCGSSPRPCTLRDLCGVRCFCLNAPSPYPTQRPNPPTQNPTVSIGNTYPPTPSALLPLPNAPSLPPSVVAATLNSIPPWQIAQSGIPTFAAFAGAPTNPLLSPLGGVPGQPIRTASPSLRPTPRRPAPGTRRPTLRPSASSPTAPLRTATPTLSRNSPVFTRRPRPSQPPTLAPTLPPSPSPSTLVPTTAFGLSGGSSPGGNLPSAPTTPPPTGPVSANANGGAAAAPPLSSGTIAGIAAGVSVLLLVIGGALCMRGREAKEDGQFKFWLRRKIEMGTLDDMLTSPMSDEQRVSTVADYHDIYAGGQAGRFGSTTPAQAAGGGRGAGSVGDPSSSYQPYTAHLAMTRTSVGPGMLPAGAMGMAHPRHSQRPPSSAVASPFSGPSSPLSPPFLRRQSGPVGAPSPAYPGPSRPPSPSASFPSPRKRGSEGL